MTFSDRFILKPLPNDGRRGPRMELDEFLQDNAMANLFLIAVSNMQQNSLEPLRDEKGELVKDENGKLVPNWWNFYGLAGIHGEPREQWNGYEQPKDYEEGDGGFPNGKFPGFCHHSLDTFPVWHRPFTAIFELAVYEEMAREAAKYKDEDEKRLYEEAAARFRLPYWDPLMPRNEYKEGGEVYEIFGTPQILAKEKIWVKKSSSSQFVKIDNPLYRFTYPTEAEHKNLKKYDSYTREPLEIKPAPGNPPIKFNPTHTTRVPTDGDTNAKMFDRAVKLHAIPLSNALFRMLDPDTFTPADEDNGAGDKIKFNEVREFWSFANNKWEHTLIENKSYKSLSIETFHDLIHMCIATGMSKSKVERGVDGAVDTDIDTMTAGHAGAMADTAYAAYDPIFPLVHNNVDRILCLYQAMYPEKWLEGEDLVRELKPFTKNSKRECWKPSDIEIREYWRCGFATPGVEKPKGDIKTIRIELMKYVSDTYNWSSNNAPPNLKHWPKDLSKCWALSEASPTAVDDSELLNVEFTALKLDDTGEASIVNRTYSLATNSEDNNTRSISLQDRPVDTANVVGNRKSVLSYLPEGALIDYDQVSEAGTQMTWSAHIKVRKYAFNRSFSVHLFIGNIKDDQPERYMTKKNEISFTGVFTSSVEHSMQCANCLRQRENDVSVSSTIPLTTFLYDYLKANPKSAKICKDSGLDPLENLTPEYVVPFLKKGLGWRIIDLGANLITGKEREAGLEVFVTSRQYTTPNDEYILGAYEDSATVHREITEGKAGGLGS